MQTNNVKAFYAPAAMLMTGLIVMGCLIGNGIKSFAEKDRYVTVKGLAEREVMADRVIWSLPFSSVGNNLQELYNTVENNNKIIVSFLHRHGITDSEINIAAPTVTDREAQSYTPENLKYRYRVETVVTVISPQVEKVLQLMKSQVELMKQGVAIGEDYQYRTRYEFTGLNSLKPEMIEEATRNARAVAQKFADDSESELAGIRQANQGQFTITSAETTPQIKKVRVVTTVDYYLK